MKKISLAAIFILAIAIMQTQNSFAQLTGQQIIQQVY